MLNSFRTTVCGIRWVIGTTLMVVLSGCLASDVPIITTSTAQNVGDKLDYWSRFADNPKSEKYRFARGEGGYYHLQILDPNNDDQSAKRTPDLVLLRRIGMRGSSVLYFVQFDFGRSELEGLTSEDMGFQYLIYFLSVDPEEIGSVGSFKCNGTIAKKKAREAGLYISCTRNLLTGDTDLPSLGGLPSQKHVLDFLLALVREGAIEWEDETGVGVFDGIF